MEKKYEPIPAVIVPTPHGKIVAYDKGDEDGYPGIWVELHRSDEKNPITLAMVEYIQGGEGLSDYNPMNRAEMDRQRNEVPATRVQKDEDGREECTPGIVTRAWPHDRVEEEFHYRTFHDEYGGEDPAYDENDTDVGAWMTVEVSERDLGDIRVHTSKKAAIAYANEKLRERVGDIDTFEEDVACGEFSDGDSWGIAYDEDFGENLCAWCNDHGNWDCHIQKIS